jgi:hypothetical protein
MWVGLLGVEPSVILTYFGCPYFTYILESLCPFCTQKVVSIKLIILTFVFALRSACESESICAIPIFIPKSFYFSALDNFRLYYKTLVICGF